MSHAMTTLEHWTIEDQMLDEEFQGILTENTPNMRPSLKSLYRYPMFIHARCGIDLLDPHLTMC